MSCIVIYEQYLMSAVELKWKWVVDLSPGIGSDAHTVALAQGRNNPTLMRHTRYSSKRAFTVYVLLALGKCNIINIPC